MKKIILGLFAFTLLFVSCDNHDEVLNSSTKKEYYSNDSKLPLKEDLNSFTINHINISNEILYIIKQNKNVDFSKLSFESLNNTRNELDLKISLENAGIENADLLIIALNKQINNFNQTLAINKDFLNLNNIERNKIVSEAIDNQILSINNSNSFLEKRTCLEQWKVDTARCTRNYYWAGGLAVVGTFATGGWGLLGVTAAIVSYRDCLADANDDYDDCVS